MAFQHLAAPTQWSHGWESDAEGEEAMRAMEATERTSQWIPNRTAASTAPWHPVSPLGARPAAGSAVPADTTTGTHLIQPWGAHTWPVGAHPGLSSSIVASPWPAALTATLQGKPNDSSAQPSFPLGTLPAASSVAAGSAVPADTSRVTNQTRPWLGAPIWPMLAQPGLSSTFNASMSGPRPVLPLDTCSNESISGHVAVAPASVPVPAAILQGQQPSQARAARGLSRRWLCHRALICYPVCRSHQVHQHRSDGACAQRRLPQLVLQLRRDVFRSDYQR